MREAAKEFPPELVQQRRLMRQSLENPSSLWHMLLDQHWQPLAVWGGEPSEILEDAFSLLIPCLPTPFQTGDILTCCVPSLEQRKEDAGAGIFLSNFYCAISLGLMAVMGEAGTIYSLSNLINGIPPDISPKRLFAAEAFRGPLKKESRLLKAAGNYFREDLSLWEFLCAYWVIQENKRHNTHVLC